jgi:hypothetical protein
MSVQSSRKMGTRSSGLSDLELVAISGEPPYSGSNAVAYTIQTPLGAYETGTANVAANWLRARTVSTSSNGNTLIPVPVPPAGVVVYLAPQVGVVDDAEEAVFADGDYGEVTVSGGGTVMELNDDIITAEHIAPGALPVEVLEGGDTLTLAEMQDELGIPNTSGKVCELRVDFIGVANGTYPLDISATFPYTITSLVHKGSEALTAAVKIGSTDVTGLAAVAVTTSTATTNATAANAVVVGNVVNIVFTDIATTGDVYVKLVVTRG